MNDGNLNRNILENLSDAAASPVNLILSQAQMKYTSRLGFGYPSLRLSVGSKSAAECMPLWLGLLKNRSLISGLLFVFILIVLPASELVAQSVHVRLTIVSLRSSGLSDGWGNTPDPTWKFDVTAKYKNSHIRSGGNWQKAYHDTRGTGTWNITDENIINQNLSLNSNSPFDLCKSNEVYLNIDFEAWEDDRGSSTNYDCCDHWKNDDNDHRQDSWRLYLKNYSANTTHTITLKQSSKFEATFELRYSLDVLDADNSLIIANQSGNAQTLFCEDDGVFVMADVHNEFKNGNWLWERATGSSWSTFGAGNDDYISITAADLETYDYRATLRNTGNCIGELSTAPTTSSVNRTIIPAAPDPSNVTVVGNSFCGSDDLGEITVTNLGGSTARYEYTLKDGDAVIANQEPAAGVLPTFSNLSGGTYKLIYTRIELKDDDQVGACSQLVTGIVVTKFLDPILDLSSQSDVKCLNGSDGEIKVRLRNFAQSGGNYSLSINGSSTAVTQASHTFTGLSAGTYNIIATSSTGCTSNTQSVTLGQPSEAVGISNTLSASYEIECNGGTVIVPIAPSGGISPYKIVGADASVTGVSLGTTYNLSFSSLGSQTVAITDANGCTFTTSAFNIVTNSKIVVTGSSEAGTGCIDSVTNAGTITINVSGGVGPYQYSLDDASFVSFAGNSIMIPNVPPGGHNIDIQDSKDCIESFAINVDAQGDIDPTQDLGFPAFTPIYCEGGTNGQITLDFSTVPDSFIFNKVGATQNQVPHDGSSSISFSSLDAGVYEFIGIPPGGACSERIEINLLDGSNPDILQVELSAHAICNGQDGRITVHTLGKADGTTSFATHPDRVETLIAQHSSGTLNLDVSPKTDDGFIAVDQVFSGGIPGSYSSFQVRSSQGCLSTVFNVSDFIIEEPEALAINYTTTDERCAGANDGTLTATITGGTEPYRAVFLANCGAPIITQDITSGTVFYDNLAPGINYSLEIEDANGCRMGVPVVGEGCDPSNGITITPASTPIINVSSSGENIDCRGDNGELTATVSLGGSNVTAEYEFSLDGIAYQPTPILAGAQQNNTVYIRHLNYGCTYSQSNVSIPFFSNSVSVDISELTSPTTCADGSIRVSISNGVAPFDVRVVDLGGDEPNCNVGQNLTIYSASTSSTTIDIPAGPGSYFVCLTDAVECSASAGEVNLGIDGGPLSLSVTSNVDESCDIGNDGAITVQASGGNGPYTITKFFENAQSGSSATFSDLGSGRFSFEVTDAEGCFAQVVDSVDRAPGTLAASFSSTAVVGCGQNPTGSAVVTITGGTGPYAYEYGVGFDEDNMVTGSTSGTINIPDIPAGELEVYIADAAGCNMVMPVIVESASSEMMVISTTATNADCGNTNGSIAVTVTGGVAAYQYSLDATTYQGTGSFTGLGAGVYTAYVMDNVSCLDSASVTINENSAISASAAATDVTCFGVNNGSIVVSASGGAGSFDYQLDAGAFQSSSTFSDLTAGTYQVTVRDGASCQLVLTDIIIQEPAEIVGAISDQTDVTCFGANDGTITAAVSSGGVAPFQYSIDGSNFGFIPSFFTLSAASYTITIRDADGCTTEIQNITIAEPAQIQLSVDSAFDQSCSDLVDGAIYSSASGGTGSLQFSLDDVTYQADSTFTALSAGDYSVYVKDENDCVEQISNIVLQQVPAMVLAVNVDQSTACNANTGQATANVTSGGTGPFTYDWDNGFSTLQTATNLSAGDHTVEITDVNGCVETETITIPQLNAPTLQLDSLINSVCDLDNGAIYLSVTGGVGPYSYDWSHDVGVDSTIATDLPEGSYSIMVTDAAGCSEEISVDVLEESGPDTLLATVVDPNCVGSGGSISYSVVGGTAPYHYLWSHDGSLNDSLATDLDSGFYKLIVTDFNGCIDSATAQLEAGEGIALSLDSLVHATCLAADGYAEISSSGFAPLTYAWSHDDTLNNNVAQGLTAGIYSVTVTDGTGCQDSIDLEIEATDSPFTTLIDVDSALCTSASGSISLVSNGATPLTYAWSHDAQLNTAVAVDLVPGIYSATVTDVNGCEDMLSAEVPSVGSIDVAIDSVHNSRCTADNGMAFGNSSGQGPFNYTWSHDTAITTAYADALAPGTYTLHVTDANGCADSSDFEVATEGALSISLFRVLDAACAADNGLIQLSLGGVPNYSFSWSHDPTLNDRRATGLSAGTYDVTVEDATGCIDSIQAVIESTGSISAEVEELSDAICTASNGSASIISSGSAPFTYDWSHDGDLDTAVADGLSPGIYEVTVADANGCIDPTTQFEIVSSGVIEASATTTYVGDCESNLATIEVVSDGLAGFQYEWSHDLSINQSSVSGLEAGDYSIVVTDANGCIDTAFASVAETIVVTVTVGEILSPTCGNTADGSAEIIATASAGNLSYLWNDAAAQTTAVATGLLGGNYTVVITDEVGCEHPFQVEIPAVESLSILSDSTTAISCYGEVDGTASVSVGGGQGTYSYLWNDVNQQTTSTASNLAAGSYTVVILDANGCSLSHDIIINEPEMLDLSLLSSTDPSCADFEDGSIVLQTSGGIASYNYQWSDDPTRNTFSAVGLTSGAYEIKVEDSNGCLDTVSVNLESADQIIVALLGIDSATCGTSSDGSISVEASGGSGNLSFIWDDNNSQTTAHATALGGGDYQLLINDENRCLDTLEATVPVRNEIIIELISIDSATCSSLHNGSATVMVQGGDDGFTYQWDDSLSQVGITAINLGPGSYTVSAVDSSGCGDFLEVVIPSASEILATVEDVVSTPCLNSATGSATIQVSNTIGSFNFLWNDSLAQTTATAVNLLPGNYLVEVSDDAGCSEIVEVEIPVESSLELELVELKNTTCAGGSDGSIEVLLNAAGAVTYQWNDTASQNSSTATGLISGEYTVLASDESGCEIEETFVVESLSSMETVGTISDASCQGLSDGSISLETSGGVSPYNYDWISIDTGGASVSQLPTGMYSVIVTDASGCETKDTFDIESEDIIDIFATSIEPATCNTTGDGSISLDVSGGSGNYDFEWSNGDSSQSISGLDAGLYTLLVKDDGGCMAQDTFELLDGGVLAFDLGNADTALCANGVLFYDFQDSDFSFAWSGPDGFSSNAKALEILEDGTYSVVVSNSDGCQVSDSIAVSFNADPLQALYIIATDVVLNDSVVAFEVSWPAPDEVEWLFDPDSATYLGSDLNQHFFQFTKLGKVNLTMAARTLTCVDLVQKTINVYSDTASLPDIGDIDNREILEFTMFPNPNDGNFDILVRLSETLPINLRVYNIDGSLIEGVRMEGQSTYQQSFSIDVNAGYHTIILNTPTKKKSFVFYVSE